MSNFNKIIEIIQNACYFLFNTVLSKIFDIKDLYITCSPQDKKIAEIIKITHSKVLNTVCGYLDDPRLFFAEQLN